MPGLSHAELCEVARRWLLRPNSKGGHGCGIAYTETFTGFGCEIPDAVGFRTKGHNDGSVVIEVKVSHRDFLADSKKPHRCEGAGIGRWRYFLCPEGLISVDELPEQWGLLYATERGSIVPIAGPALALNASSHAYSKFLAACEAFAQPSDLTREVFLLSSLLGRVSDSHLRNRQLRDLRRLTQRVSAQYDAAAKENERLVGLLLDAGIPPNGAKVDAGGEARADASD